MQVKIKKLHPDAVIPQYATSGSACFDLTAVGEPSLNGNDGRAMTYGTGLAFGIPKDHVMLVFSRSGHGFKDAVRLSNCVGVVDADFVGEVKVSLRFDGHFALRTDLAGTRIAQAMILPVQQVSFLEVDELGTTERGTGGLGSTGSGPLASQEDDGWGPWIEWAGGDEPPIADVVVFRFRLRKGNPSGSGPFRTASAFRWTQSGLAGDIVAYRVKKEH